MSNHRILCPHCLATAHYHGYHRDPGMEGDIDDLWDDIPRPGRSYNQYKCENGHHFVFNARVQEYLRAGRLPKSIQEHAKDMALRIAEKANGDSNLR